MNAFILVLIVSVIIVATVAFAEHFKATRAVIISP